MTSSVIKEEVVEMDGRRHKKQLIKVSYNKKREPDWFPFFSVRNLVNAESMLGFAMMSCSAFNQTV